MIFAEVEEYVLNGEQQNLPGFDEKYTNIVDYILKITEEIWEDRAIWVIYETYTEDIVIHTGARTIHGIESVVLGTVKTLGSFPDRKMGGEAVIWSKVDDNQFYSSHRIGSTATNTGKSEFGNATGKKVFFRTIADCCVRENKIFEEWLVRDNLHLVEQLGFDPVEMAKRDQRYKGIPITFSQNGVLDIIPNGRPLNLQNPNDLIISLFANVWKSQNFDHLQQYYHRFSTIHAIQNKDLIGFADLQSYLSHLMASFPEAKITLERVSSNKKGNTSEVAARWKVEGIHSGNGFFGTASGKPIVMPVISHFIVENGKILEEWMVFDAFDVLCQIHS